jgi:BMFP domain-containing protein YqiC
MSEEILMRLGNTLKHLAGRVNALSADLRETREALAELRGQVGVESRLALLEARSTVPARDGLEARLEARVALLEARDTRGAADVG